MFSWVKSSFTSLSYPKNEIISPQTTKLWTSSPNGGLIFFPSNLSSIYFSLILYYFSLWYFLSYLSFSACCLYSLNYYASSSLFFPFLSFFRDFVGDTSSSSYWTVSWSLVIEARVGSCINLSKLSILPFLGIRFCCVCGLFKIC